MNLLAKYQSVLASLAKGPYLSYPLEVRLETHTICNARCRFCAYPSLQRRGGVMSDDLLSKILSDLRKIPAALPMRLKPFWLDEFFLDPRAADILRAIKTTLPQAKIAINTNGARLGPQEMELLAEVPNLVHFSLSLNDHRRSQYESAMSLDYDNTLKQLDFAHNWVRHNRFPTAVILSRVGDGSQADLEFSQWVAHRYPSFTAVVRPAGNWLGDRASAPPATPAVGCWEWFSLTVASTGQAGWCCLDAEMRYSPGNVAQMPVLDLYNQPRLRKLRQETVQRSALTPCSRCGYLSASMIGPAERQHLAH